MLRGPKSEWRSAGTRHRLSVGRIGLALFLTAALGGSAQAQRQQQQQEQRVGTITEALLTTEPVEPNLFAVAEMAFDILERINERLESESWQEEIEEVLDERLGGHGAGLNRIEQTLSTLNETLMEINKTCSL